MNGILVVCIVWMSIIVMLCGQEILSLEFTLVIQALNGIFTLLAMAIKHQWDKEKEPQ